MRWVGKSTVDWTTQTVPADQQIHAAIASHYGESHIRLRFAEWLSRFTRLAADQECRHTGSTKIGFPTRPFRDGALGSGAVFSDDATRQKEMRANGHRIDAWRRTKGYKTFAKVRRSPRAYWLAYCNVLLADGAVPRILSPKSRSDGSSMMCSIKSRG